MISVEEALDILLRNRKDSGSEKVSLHQSTGRVLREDIIADRDMPPFDRVAMDGIAIQYESYKNKLRTFFISGMAAAGAPQQNLSGYDQCLEIMTGAGLPLNADTIVPYEWITIENDIATINNENVVEGQNIHRMATDRAIGDLLITQGRVITAGEMGILASVGKNNVSVSTLPRILIISTGDELTEIEIDPLPHQVRMSNVHQLQAALHQIKITADRIHLTDNFEQVKASIHQSIPRYDILIISGGISEGKFDYIPSALESLGVQKHFHKVKQRPGKPFWFGTHPDGCTVFGIPGNPVSSFMCCVRYILPWLEACLQKEISQPTLAKLSEDVSFAPDLTYYMTVKLSQNENAEIIAVPMKGHGSGDLSILADTDAFIELPRGKERFRKGEVFHVYKFRR